MPTDSMEEISIVGGGEAITTGEEIDKEDGVEKIELLAGRICSGNHRLTCSVERGRVVHLGVAMFDGRVAGDEG